ncbi:sunset domain-containing protein [Mesorhizobium sp. LjNodule214]|uniref:sunset domain-containing protein n=1 Tax=Mesorhizobium sp. LjNodule214 TaxID=3342252 RepID=UPI003ECE2293
MGNIIHAARTRRRKPWWRSLLRYRLITVLAMLGVTSAAYFAIDDRHDLPRVHHGGGSSTSNAAVRKAGCDIKGNINERGEHIYHMPGQEYYSATRINPARGERWFCSQWEAWWAGWRKAKV